MARFKLSGTLVKRADGSYSARVPQIVEGVRVKPTYQLGTTSRALAKRRLARLIADLEAKRPVGKDAGTRTETFAEAANRWHAKRVSDGVKSAKTEKARLRDFALPTLAKLDVTQIGPLEINDVLDDCKSAGKSRQTVVHLNADLSNVFAMLKREGAVAVNPVDEAELPKFRDQDEKQRAVLTDEELMHYLAWQHPQPRHQGAVLERQMMSAVARCFGGLRTGDLHALRWESLDSEHGAFTWGWAPRRKTKSPQKLEIPEVLRPVLRDWWERHGRPKVGPVFATRRGKRAGTERLKTSHAEAFRRDLERVFGLVSWRQTGRDRKGGPLGTWEPTPGRELTQRERELFTETPNTLPVDFHSWRRAISQALAEANVNAQQAQSILGHDDAVTHRLYLRNATKMTHVPENALPPSLDVFAVQFSGPAVQKLPEVSRDPGMYQGERASEKRRPVQGNLPPGSRAY